MFEKKGSEEEMRHCFELNSVEYHGLLELLKRIYDEKPTRFLEELIRTIEQTYKCRED
jgi:hypothetical protein